MRSTRVKRALAPALLCLLSLALVAHVHAHGHDGDADASADAGEVAHAHAHDPNPLELLRPESTVVDLLAGASLVLHASGPLKGAGQNVQLSWSGMPAKEKGNWIGIFSPPPANFSRALPTKYFELAASHGPSGKRSVWLLNQRAPSVAVFFRGGLTHPVVVAVSNVVTFASDSVPTQLHLAYTRDAAEMRVSWTTNSTYNPLVRWGLVGQKSMGQASGNTSTYTAKQMCGAPATGIAFRDPGQLHTAVMTGLKPSTQYWYKVGDGNTMSPAITFWSAPAAAPNSEVDFFVFGDLGGSEPDGWREHAGFRAARNTLQSMQKDVNDGTVALNKGGAIFHIGDISYARGYAATWEQFFHSIGNISASAPWMVTDGNHERDWPGSGSLFEGKDSGGECGVPFNYRFTMPHEHQSNRDETWWAVTHGPVKWIVISTEHAFKAGSAQYKFVQDQLENVNRKKTPFVMLAGHRPMYAYAMMNPIAASLRKAYEPLMRKHKVDAAFWGHQHAYQRTCAIDGVKCVASGTVHFVTGAPGAPMSDINAAKAPAWVRHIEVVQHGYMRGRVRGGKMTLEYVASAAGSMQGKVLDSVVIQSKFGVEGEYIGANAAELEADQQADPITGRVATE